MGAFRLWAHPEYYDYIQTITFLDDFRVELFYGECQGARYEALGDYSLTDTTLTITNLKEVDADIDTNDNDESTVQQHNGTIPEADAALTKTTTTLDIGFKEPGQLGTTAVYKFKKETGIYEWVEELTGKKKSATERYIFDQDPCDVDDGKVIFYRL